MWLYQPNNLLAVYYQLSQDCRSLMTVGYAMTASAHMSVKSEGKKFKFVAFLHRQFSCFNWHSSKSRFLARVKLICSRNCITLSYVYWRVGGRDSSVGIATRYGLDGHGIESRWGAGFSAPAQTGPGAHPASCTMGTGSFPG